MSDLISRHGVSAWLDNLGHRKLADMIMNEDRFPNVVWEDGATGCHYKKDLFRTGRHFDEVEELLKKMGGEA